MPIIEVNHVTKEFRLGEARSLKETLRRTARRLQGKGVEALIPFKALDDVSFKIQEGEVLGIIGQNGAGKSTLLKILAGISRPTRGSVSVHGRVAPLIEVGAGLVPDLTGRENVYLNAAILGMKRAEIKRKFEEIISFAELETFVDTPVKRYSSGMQVRLGFAIATSVEANTLIVDEVLAVGDLAFQRKCFDRMEQLIKRQGRTVLLVSHNIRHVERICSRTILLDHGKILKDGNPVDVCNTFYMRSDEKIKNTAAKVRAGPLSARHEASGEAELLSIEMIGEQGRRTDTVLHGTDVIIELQYQINKGLTKPVFGIGVHTTDFVYLSTQHSDAQLRIAKLSPGFFKVRCRIDNFPLSPGVYSLCAGIAAGDFYGKVFFAENLYHFTVGAKKVRWAESMREGFFDLNASWERVSPDSEAQRQPPEARSVARPA